VTEPTDDELAAPITDGVARRPISRWPVVVTVVALALAGVLVYVGGRLSATPASPPDLSHPGTTDHPRDVTVIMKDYVFTPTPVYLVPGETVRFAVINGGMLEHEFVLGDATVQHAWAAADAAATPPGLLATAPPASVPAGTGGIRLLLKPGEQATALYDVPVDERLQLACHLPGHVERGMVGSVILASK
jgi:uncharacterized cupredoxin-like copper-binding protein